ncbi:MAG TPA: tetratricopeptide repeat protein [Kofleriaceae bacterium]|nr:tetratricopeptide repeat protein [Kofleriaceae bacterium]
MPVAAAPDKPTAGKKPPAPAGPRMAPDDLPGPQPEIAGETDKVDLPAVPAFALPAVEPGFHGPRELRLQGRHLLGTEIKLRGYITWIYDCAAQLASQNPSATRVQIAGAIQRDPTLCERAKFLVGDARDTPRDASIQVVDVPRPARKAERGTRKQSELKGLWPDVPRLALGDYITVTGNWALVSPHAEHNTDGLLVYKALEHLPPPAAPPGSTPAATDEPDIDVVTKLPLRKVITNEIRNASVDHLNACNKAIAARQYDAGIAECQAAVSAWPDNHLAWYAWGSAHMAKGEWQKAREAVEHAVTLRPDHAMYQLYDGISLYEAELERVREDQARKDGKQPEEVVIEPAQLQLDAARDALRRAARLDPRLWRAHYYLGRVYRDLDDSRHAAEQFALTITTHPSYRFGYVALVELYRRWSYNDQAAAVAQQGTQHVAAAESGDLWFELGMAYDAKRDDDKAIEAFTRALAVRPGDLGSKFQRGQAYFRKNDYASAKRDLDEVARSTDPAVASTKPLAVQMLDQIARKH